MTFTDAFVTLGVLGGFAFMIISNSPKMQVGLKKFKDWVTEGGLTQKIPLEPMTDRIEQIHDEKRAMM